MTLTKAIEELRKLHKELDIPQRVKGREAVKLGIEAMKAFKCGREGLRTEFNTLLLGETEE